MKNKYGFILLLFSFFQSGFVSAQQWSSYSPTASFDVNAVDILKPGYIVLGGGREKDDSVQIMFYSPDYGVTWNENPHDGLGSWNKSIAFADTLNGYGVGYQGRIVSTNDGGQNWGHAIFPTNKNINKVVNVTPYLYYAVGGKQNNGSMQTILKTTNLGATWNVIYDTAGPCLKSVYFFDASKGYAVGDSGVILATTNGGGTWNSITAPVQRNFNAITFINIDTGFIAGGDVTHRTILRTDDGGVNWTIVTDNIGSVLYDISFVDELEGYMAGDSAAVIKTTDGGQNWVPQQISNSLNGTELFNAIKFYDHNFGLVGGKGGVLFIYTGWPIDIYTLGAEVKDSTTADVFVSVNTRGLPGFISFTYSTDSSFSTSVSTPVQSVTTDTLFPTYTQLANLLPHTWYYYFAKSGNKTGDTLRFYTGSAYPVFQTLPGDVINSTTLLLKGDIHGITPVSNIEFEYGTTPLLGNVIAASPAAVNDTADHAISALLTSAQPSTIYYFRMRGETAGDTIYGNIHFTGSLFGTLQTLPVTYSNDTSAGLSGVEQGYPEPVNLSFEYGLPQGPTYETYPYYVANSDTSLPVMVSVNGLQPNQLYNYRIKARSGTGIQYGQLLAFFTGSTDSVIKTLSAQNVTSTSAMLEGSVNHFPVPVSLSFEYSSDSSFSNSLTASPATVSDTLFHSVSALLTGVPVNKIYYYRLKAVAANGAIVYGNMHTVFIGDNEIPNWDFQNWDSHTYAVPTGWNIATKSFNRVPGHSGNYALNLVGNNIAILGYPSEEKGNTPGVKFVGGVPFTGRPDSISFYIKGSLTPGDSAAVIVYLHKDSIKIAKNITLISVNTGGVFQRISLPISYSSALNPDSLILGITTVNPNYPTFGNQNNNITVDDFAFIPATAPVYNGNLETWFDYPTEIPDSWYSPLFIGLDSNNLGLPVVTTKTLFSAPWDYAAEVKNIFIPSVAWMAGIMGLKVGTFYGDETPSFAVSTKHYSLNGFYQAYPDNGDTMVIAVTMYYQGQSIGGGWFTVTDTVSQFSPFEIGIGYTFPMVSIPDSADIEIRSSGGDPKITRGHSRWIVDKLHFDGFVTGVDDGTIATSPFDVNGFKVYPNPSNDLMTVEISEPMNDASVIEIYNLNGQKQKELKLPAGESKTSFTVLDMEHGFYILRLVNGNKAVQKKIVVIK